MAIAPSEASANIAKIDEIIFKNKNREKGSFGGIVAERTTLMLIITYNSIKVPGQKLGNV